MNFLMSKGQKRKDTTSTENEPVDEIKRLRDLVANTGRNEPREVRPHFGSLTHPGNLQRHTYISNGTHSRGGITYGFMPRMSQHNYQSIRHQITNGGATLTNMHYALSRPYLAANRPQLQPRVFSHYQTANNSVMDVFPGTSNTMNKHMKPPFLNPVSKAYARNPWNPVTDPYAPVQPFTNAKPSLDMQLGRTSPGLLDFLTSPQHTSYNSVARPKSYLNTRQTLTTSQDSQSLQFQIESRILELYKQPVSESSTQCDLRTISETSSSSDCSICSRSPSATSTIVSTNSDVHTIEKQVDNRYNDKCVGINKGDESQKKECNVFTTSGIKKSSNYSESGVSASSPTNGNNITGHYETEDKRKGNAAETSASTSRSELKDVLEGTQRFACIGQTTIFASSADNCKECKASKLNSLNFESQGLVFSEAKTFQSRDDSSPARERLADKSEDIAANDDVKTKKFFRGNNGSNLCNDLFIHIPAPTLTPSETEKLPKKESALVRHEDYLLNQESSEEDEIHVD